MIRHLVIALLCAACFVPITAPAADRYAGNWNMISMSLSVQIKSWGEHCGPRPGSYRSNASRPVVIVAKDRHLIFSKGGTRTDRCGSPNPRLSTISQHVGPGTWERICKTSKDDPKSETGHYKLVTEGAQKLIYTAVSHFDWTLKGDHCVASSEERRVYVAAKAVKKVDGTIGNSATPPTVDPTATTDCEQSGSVKQLTVLPRSTRIGPGQKACFKAIGIDETGCRFPVDAKWTATQNKKIVLGLVTQNGCFRAGPTAADAEGRYNITAKVGNKSVSAKITVVYPDLGDLFAARLKPLEDVEEDLPQAKPETQSRRPVVIKPASTRVQSGSFDASTLLVPAILITILGLAMVVVILIRKNRLTKDAGRSNIRPDDPVSLVPTEIGRTKRWQICPTCGMKLPKEALFCPHDRTSLAPEESASEADGDYPSSLSNTGMVCPTCHRGYDQGSKFCPHDSEALIPYPEWRKLNRS
jgi:hypothetical protein